MPTKKELEQKLEKYEKQAKKQYARQNEFQKNNYKRLNLCLKNDMYAELVEIYGEGFNLSGYIKGLISADIESKSAN